MMSCDDITTKQAYNLEAEPSVLSRNHYMEFFRAIKFDDINKVLELIDDEEGANLINVENQEGKTSFQVALEMENYAIAEVLIQNGVQLNTILLRMIESDRPAAVEFICEHRDMIQEHCHMHIMDGPAENDEYSVETTPILLAAEKNNYHILKILLSHGASMPTYEDIKSKYGHLPATQLTRIIYRYYNAISAEAYLLQTEGNLVTDIFNLFKDMKKAKRDKKGMNDEFEMLTGSLEGVSRKVLDLTRNETEVRHILAGDKAKKLEMCGHCNQHVIVPRIIKEAVLLDVKGFLAHDKCQAALTDLWYEGLFTDAQQSLVKRLASAALLLCLYPLLCVLYIFFPCGPIRRMLKIPFVKFVLHTASRLTFLGLLIFTTLNLTINLDDATHDLEATKDDIIASYLSYRSADIHDVSRVCIFLWILGMTLREINDVRRLGRKMYVKIIFSAPDILQLLLYWFYIILSFVAILQAHGTVADPQFLALFIPTPPPQNCEENYPPPPPPPDPFRSNPSERSSAMPPSINDTSILDLPSYIYPPADESSRALCKDYDPPVAGPPADPFGSGTLSVRFGDESRNDWESLDPVLLAEAAFALANILTFGRLLQTVILISGRLGILAISLFGMVEDIVKFLILFSVTWISFSLGMTQLYRPFNELQLLECKESRNGPWDECEEPAFIDLVESMKTLFWALFGMTELDSLQIKDGEMSLTESLGHFMFALYLLVAVIVLLNALIAMMSSTYARVQENAEMEWKYTRSIMMTGYITEGAILPPPFNLVPDIWLFLSCLNPHKKRKLQERNTQINNRRDQFQKTNQAITKRYIFELLRQTTRTRQHSMLKTRTDQL